MKKILLIICFALFSFVGAAAHAQAPDAVFKDEFGRQFSLKDYVGRPVIVIGWTSWCPVCITEIINLDARYDEIVQNYNVTILAISHDSTDDAVATFRTNYNIYNLPLLIDSPKSVSNAFGFTSIPYGIVLDASGNVVNNLRAAQDKSLLEALLETVREMQN